MIDKSAIYWYNLKYIFKIDMPDAKGVEKHGESSQIIGGGRRSDAAGGDTFGAYAVMDLRGPALGRRVRLPERAAELQKAEKRRIVRDLT